MLVPRQAVDDVDDVVADNVPADDVVDVVADDVVAHAATEPTPPSPTPTTTTTSKRNLLNTLLETCTALTRRVENLEQDKVAQALDITKLKQKVRKLKRKNKLKVSGLKRLRKVRTTQRVESSVDTVMDDQEDESKQGRIIALIDVDEDVTLEEVAAEESGKDAEDADVQGRLEESQA
nr:hypothetical protein [Tanacetum cinerariifolium]